MSTVSSTSSSTTLSSLTATTGIGGLVSGLDTDTIVESLTSVTREKIAAQQQKLQLLEWKQTAYQSVTTALKEFQDKYLDVLSDTNLGSASLYNTIAATSSSTAVSATTDSSVTSTGSITIDSITQLATSEEYESTDAVTETLGGTLSTTDYASLVSDLSDSSILVTKDGTTKTVTFDSTFEDAYTAAIASGSTEEESFEAAVQASVDEAFGDGIITISVSSGEIEFSCSGSEVTVNDVGSTTILEDYFGMDDGQSNILDTSTAIEDTTFATVLSGADSYSFTINDVDFSFSSSDSIQDIIDEVNSSDAGVTMSYSSLTDTFTLSSDTMGTGYNISVTDDDGLLTSMGLAGDTTTRTEGKNAILEVDGTTITRDSNEITINGVDITLNDTSDEEITISLTTDTTELEETITSFVEDYNSLISLINGLVSEDTYSDYEPLTDDQKEEMTDDEIEAWEEKAKSGILKGDSLLRGISSKLQSIMYSSAVKGGLSLYDLGIETGSYDSYGELEIDTDKLQETLSSNIAGVIELFTTDTTGLSDALDSVIDGAASTSGGRGNRGSLVEKAGYEDTTSSTQNYLYDSIEAVNDYIEKLQDKLESEEERYWDQFTALETALQNLNSQASIITSFSSSS